MEAGAEILTGKDALRIDDSSSAPSADWPAIGEAAGGDAAGGDAAGESVVEAAVESPAVEAATRPYVGRWNRLVSTTNWEKGRIISEWRAALIEAGTAAADYADEAWARRVGGVTSQHVGRLRRVSQRFGQVYADYAGLYWSHFQAALDWDDAELWLEGGVQSGWSVAEMRRKRWEALGSLAADRPRDEDIVAVDPDEDADPRLDQQPEPPRAGVPSAPAPFSDESGGPRPEGPDFGEEAGSPTDGGDGAAIFADEPPGETVNFVRPFESLGELPEDLAEAFELFKLALLRHKTDHWRQISCEDVLASLDALKELAVAPSAD